MEKNVVKQHIREIIKVETKFSVIEECAVELQQSQSKSLINLKAEEQILKIQLENLKKENFSLKASIKAWKTTYEQKQKELAEAKLKLNEVYNTIWSKREEFCTRADKFNNQYGILSSWWKEKVDEIFNPHQQKAHKKYSENSNKIIEEPQKAEVSEEKDKQLEIATLETLKSESPASNRQKPQEEISAKPDNKGTSQFNENLKTKKSFTTFNESKTTELTTEASEKLISTERPKNGGTSESSFAGRITENPKKKKVRFSKETDKITVFKENPFAVKNKFFSIVDRETVKKANRFKNKTSLLTKAQNLKN